MEKIKTLKETKEKLIDALNGKMSMGIENVDAQEAGEVTDMIKDLAEAEKECWEAAYYESVVKAMKDADNGDMKGYDDWRYASGRFAPKGRGTYDGYTPTYPTVYSDQMGYTDRMNDGRNDMRGYEGDPMDELAKLWQEADMDTKHRMKSALEEMARSLG